MTEHSQYSHIYKDLSPEQRNQNLKGLFDLVPTGRFKEGYVKRSLERRDSELRSITRDKLDSLLTFAHGTKSSLDYVRYNYDDLFITGVGPRNLGIISRELEQLNTVYRWNDNNNGGIFSPLEAPEIEGVAYHKAANKLGFIRRLEIVVEDKFANDPEWKELMQRFKDENTAYKIFKQVMSPEELSEHEEVAQRIKQYNNYDDERISKLDSIVKQWRFEYIKLYGNEP